MKTKYVSGVLQFLRHITQVCVRRLWLLRILDNSASAPFVTPCCNACQSLRLIAASACFDQARTHRADFSHLSLW